MLLLILSTGKSHDACLMKCWSNLSATSHSLHIIQDSVCLDYFQVSSFIQLEFTYSAPSPNASEYLITVKLCDEKPSLNCLNLKNSQKQIRTSLHVTVEGVGVSKVRVYKLESFFVSWDIKPFLNLYACQKL